MGSSPLVLITGVNGFVGKHMAAYLLSLGINVIGIGRSPNCSILHERFQYMNCDITDRAAVHLLLQQHRFEYVIHLAGENDVRTSFLHPSRVLQVNAFATAQLLEAARIQLSGDLKGFLTIGTGYEYEIHAIPLTEDAKLAPLSPYAWSKLVMTSVTQMYGQLLKLPVLTARTFNLVGPGQTTGVCAQLVRQVVQMERGSLPPKLFVGDQTVHRDFLDVRDAVAAYWSLLLKTSVTPGDVYNVCSGHTHSVGDMIDMIRRNATMPLEVAIDESLLRKGDPPMMIGDSTKLRTATGWKPNITLEQSIVDVLNEHRKLR